MASESQTNLTRRILAEIDRKVNQVVTPTSLPTLKLPPLPAKAKEAAGRVAGRGDDTATTTGQEASTSAARILELNVVEKKIVGLLKVASKIMELLATQDHDEALNDNLNATSIFSAHSGLKQLDADIQQYVRTLHEIQLSMRRQHHYLLQSGTVKINLPYQASVYDADKSLDTLTRAISLIRAELTALTAL